MPQEIEIIYDEPGWMAVSKPSGLSVHNPEDGQNLLEILGNACDSKLHAAHRLDKETSGIILLAKDKLHTRIIQEALKTAKKTYLAVVRGQTRESGDWKQPLTNKSEGFKNPAGKTNARVDALTTYHRLYSNQHLSLLQLELKTGRQHQLRKHAVINGHQIIGDRRYGNKKHNAMIQKRYGFQGMCLHAAGLHIEIDKKKFNFESPAPEAWEIFKLSEEI